jgi:hypothetical protein
VIKKCGKFVVDFIYLVIKVLMSDAPLTDPVLKKKRSAPYKQEAYYWRGGDALREKEYVIDEFKKASDELRRCEHERDQVESDIVVAEETLRQREEYTSALAGFLDSDAEGGQQEAYYKRRLAFIESEMRIAESDLQEVRALHNPAVSSGLQKEKAYLIIDNQRLSKAIELADEEYSNCKRQTAACMASSKYGRAVELEGRVQDLQRKRSFLRQLVSEKKKDFDATRPVAPIQSEEGRRERTVLMVCEETELGTLRTEERRTRNPKKWDHRLSRLIDFIEDLNERLLDLGISDTADTEALRKDFLSHPAEDGKRVKKKVKKHKKTENAGEETKPETETEAEAETAAD